MTYITDCWYVAGWAEEVAAKPLRRIFMNMPVVMFRCSDGAVAAIEDRCSHRNFPLSMGIFDGDTLQCGYHGLTFDRKGTCIFAPGQDRPPPRADIAAYPIEERHGLLWIWLGEADAANSETIPDLSWMTTPESVKATGNFALLAAAEQSVAENLLDISHISFVHQSSLGGDPNRTSNGEIHVEIKDFGIQRIVTFADMPTPKVYAQSVSAPRIDQRTESSMRPGLYQNNVVIKPTGEYDWHEKGSGGDYPVRSRSFHGITPERDGHTYDFFGSASWNIDSSVMNADTFRQIIQEDVVVLEAIERNMELVADRPTINLRNDLAVMRWRTYRADRLGASAKVA